MAVPVSKHQALRLAKEYPADRIREQLLSLPYRDAKNPSGYIVRAIEQGYPPAPQLREVQERQEAAARREAEAQRKRAQDEERRRVGEAQHRAIEAVLTQLSQEEQTALEEATARQIARYSPKIASQKDSPMFRATLRQLVAERYLPDRQAGLDAQAAAEAGIVGLGAR